MLRDSSTSLGMTDSLWLSYEHTRTYRYYLDRKRIPVYWTGLELSYGPWLHWKRSFLDAFSRSMARLRAAGREHYSSLVLVLEHCLTLTHRHLFYFCKRSV